MKSCHKSLMVIPLSRIRIVITGSEGFIGSHLRQGLQKEGFDVWGIDCVGESEPHLIKADLLDFDEAANAIKACLPFGVVIHTAALAHGQEIRSDDSYERINTAITNNVLKSVDAKGVRFIILSSVAVYGEDKRAGPVSERADVRPSTDYGKSKLACERIVLDSGLKDYKILRLSPVYSEQHLEDIRKRVFLPGPIKAKVRLIPSPSYSFCHVDTIVEMVINSVSETSTLGTAIQNVADSKPHKQKELLSWFPGQGIPLPTMLFKPFYYMTYLLPPRRGYGIRCMYWKLFNSNVYG